MSHTSHDGTRTLHAVPGPSPLTGLTGAPATVYTELTGRTEPTTAAELALASGLGRSTTSKALVTLEEHGLALRTPGGHDGALRTPDRWRAAPTLDTTPNSGDDTEPDTPTTNDTTDPDASGDTENEEPPAEGTPTETPDEPDAGTAPAADTPPQDDEPEQDGDGGPESGHPAASPSETKPEPRPLQLVTAPSDKDRLAPGALRQLVIDHLKNHPGEAFTATRISRVIDKSSGAIANALVKLTQQGIAEKVTDYPRTYRWAGPQAATE